MKKKFIKKLSLKKQTIVDLNIGEQTNIKGGNTDSKLFPICPEKTTLCTGDTCWVETGCVPAGPSECHC